MQYINIFFLTDHQVQDFCDTRLNSTFMPGCFLFTLKVVKFERFAGTKHELNFAKLVMNNAQALERITFSCCPKLLGQKKWENVKENISSFKSTFSSVVIEFFILGYISFLKESGMQNADGTYLL